MKSAGRLVTAGGAYVAVGVAAWWELFAHGIAHTITSSGWGDPAQQVWFLGWLPHALGAGIDPFVSHAIFAPAGINLMANTSILFPALVISPVTVLFGPLVAFNVMVVLAPAASAFVSYLVFRRYTSFELGAFLGGLFYGYSPFVLNDLADGHLHVTTLVFAPLVFLLVDDIAVSPKGSPKRRGLLLGLVLTAQALTSLEVLAILVWSAAIGLVLLAVRFPREVASRWRPALLGLATAALSTAVLLAWPAEVLFAGPRRVSGRVFSSPESYVVWLKALVWPRGGPAGLPHLWPAYIGIPLLLVVAAGAWGAAKSLVRFCLVLALVDLVFAAGRSLHLTPGVATPIGLPDRFITNLPVFENLLPVRFMIVIDLLVAISLAVSLGALRERLSSRLDKGAEASGAEPKAFLARWKVGTVAAGGVGLLALVSPFLGARWPYPTRQVSVPGVYRSAEISGLPAGSVLLAYPVMNGFEADPMIWQAEGSFGYDMVAGYGFVPSGGPRPIGSLASSPVTTLFGDAQIGFLGATLDSSRVEAVRQELSSLKVSDVVVLDRGKRPGRLAGILTTVLDKAPRHIDGAWVWLDLRPAALGS